MKNYQIILTAIVSFGVAYSILFGYIPSRYFAGELNELGCAVIALTMGTLCVIGYDWKSLINHLNK